jgi:hypothetical protein
MVRLSNEKRTSLTPQPQQTQQINRRGADDAAAGDSHRQFRFMLHIGRRSEKIESAFVATPSAEQPDARALVSMMLVSLPGRTFGAIYRLTLQGPD